MPGMYRLPVMLQSATTSGARGNGVDPRRGPWRLPTEVNRGRPAFAASRAAARHFSPGGEKWWSFARRARTYFDNACHLRSDVERAPDGASDS